MLCPTCSCDLSNLSFVNSLSHVTNCIDAKGKKAKKKVRPKKRVQSHDWYQTTNDKPPDRVNPTEPKLVVTKKGYIYQAHPLLSKDEVNARVNKIFRATIPKNSESIATGKEHVPLELSVRKSDSYTARGFDKYITQETSLHHPDKISTSQRRLCDSPDGGFLLEDRLL